MASREIEQEQLLEELLKQPGGQMAFQIERSDESVEKLPEAFVSEEAFDAMMSQIATFIGTRFMRRQRARGKGVRKLDVLVSMTMDGEDPETTEVVRLPPIDGSHRVGGKR